VAEACRHVPAKPARNLFEGLQAIILIHLAIYIEGHGMSVSIGLPDRVLRPFIDDDFDEEEAVDLIAAFILKIAANSLFGRASKTQAITIGGADHTGRDFSNALTRCFLKACERVRVGDPHLFLRWHAGIAPDIARRAVEMLSSGISMPLLINDAPTAQGFISAGVAPEDAWEYCVIGCNELGIPGRCSDSATSHSGLIQHLALLDETLLERPDAERIADMADLLGRIEETMRRRLTQLRHAEIKRKGRVASRVPTPFTSSLMRDCVENCPR
jgi:pyruvate-formate lyase